MEQVSNIDKINFIVNVTMNSSYSDAERFDAVTELSQGSSKIVDAVYNTLKEHEDIIRNLEQNNYSLNLENNDLYLELEEYRYG